jgi:hypothetical protein
MTKRYWAEVTFRDLTGALRTKRVLGTSQRDTWSNRGSAELRARARAQAGIDSGWTDVHVTVRECATDAIVYEAKVHA